MSTYKTQAIILKESDCLEADRLFYIYTQKYGKVQLKVKGGKKIQSKLSPHLQSMAMLDLLIARGRNYDRLAAVQLRQNFLQLKTSFTKIIIASYFLEIIEQLTKLNHPDQALLDLLADYLNLLDKKNFDQIKFRNLINFFTLKLLVLLGYAPQLYFCLSCHKKIIPDGNYFNPARGGLICQNCQKQNEAQAIKISTPAIKIIRFVAKENIGRLIKIQINQALSQELAHLVEEFLAYHLDRELKSKNFINLLLTSP